MSFSCSVERNTWTSKAYHNTTAHFNGYFYANEEIKEIEATIRQSQVDDYNDVLRLFPSFDSSMASGYSKEAEEAIKMASLSIQRHSNSKWVDDAYILVGKARHYTLDWPNAVQTFKHVNSKSKDKNARHLAIINLIRTYIETKEFSNAKSAIDFLAKAKLNAVNEKKYNLEKAYYYQLMGDYDNMVRSLTAADRHLKKSDKKGRIYFIIGQVYQELGFEAEAYNYYKKCIATNPEFEVDFYARLYMAQVTEINRGKDITTARKSFVKLLKDSKNKEFQDKIYYEMGIFELKQNNLPNAIAHFNSSVRKGNNKKIDGEAFLRLGEIYYDTLRNYELSQAYYDSAIQALPTDYENYSLIKQRAEILNEFVAQLKTIQWQDSLLTLAAMDTASLRLKIEVALSEKIKEEQEREAKKKKASKRVDLSGGNTSSAFANNDNTDGADWYFGNPSAMAIGQTEFMRVWGDVKLEDNWRRSQRQSVRTISQDQVTANNTTIETNPTDQKQETADPIQMEFTRLIEQIPYTQAEKDTALSKIEKAYLKLGDIYHFKLNEVENARTTYLTLLERFPNSEYEPEVLYALYILTKDVSPAEAENYGNTLKRKYPNSTFAKILINPDYLHESGLAIEKQKVIYKHAYELFINYQYDSSRQVLQSAHALGETNFTPNLKLLDIMLIGKLEDISRYQFELDNFIRQYEQADIAAYAQKLLETSRKFQQAEEKRKGIRYILSLDEPHYFVIVHPRKEKLEPSGDLEKFNQANFKSQDLKTSNLILNDEFAITFVSGFHDKLAATEYFKTFTEKRSQMKGLGNHKLHNFVITKNNFDIFYRTKGLDEYLQFFEKNYTDENQ